MTIKTTSVIKTANHDVTVITYEQDDTDIIAKVDMNGMSIELDTFSTLCLVRELFGAFNKNQQKNLVDILSKRID